MAHENSPSSIMYQELKLMGVSNSDAARILLDTSRSFGGTPVLNRIESRTGLSRTIVHVAPGEISTSMFKDFTQSSQMLLGRIISKLPSRSQSEIGGLAKRLSGESAEEMCRALAEYGLDEHVYQNALSHINNLPLSSETDRALLFLLLLVSVGCMGDPREGARVTERFASSRLGSSFRTTVHTVGDAVDEEIGSSSLSLVRIVGGRLKGEDACYRLSEDAQGTEIGSIACTPHAITDVDVDVSRRHARIYKQGDHWYIVGLNSTNGTTVIAGDGKVERVVEPPRRSRARDWKPEPVEIFPTDTVCLGVSTRFMVMPILDE